MINTPLAHIQPPAQPEQAGVFMQEDALFGHLNLRGNPQDKAFTDAIKHVLGIALPLSPCSSSRKDHNCSYWLGPDEWLLVVAPDTQAQVAADLREALAGQHVAITDVSSGQTRVSLWGDKVYQVMQKSTPYDCHPDHFAVGKVVQTSFAKTTALISRPDATKFELIVRRSFADYFFLWLQDASAEYGLQVMER